MLGVKTQQGHEPDDTVELLNRAGNHLPRTSVVRDN